MPKNNNNIIFFGILILIFVGLFYFCKKNNLKENFNNNPFTDNDNILNIIGLFFEKKGEEEVLSVEEEEYYKTSINKFLSDYEDVKYDSIKSIVNEILESIIIDDFPINQITDLHIRYMFLIIRLVIDKDKDTGFIKNIFNKTNKQYLENNFNNPVETDFNNPIPLLPLDEKKINDYNFQEKINLIKNELEKIENYSPSPAPAPADKQEVNHNPSPSPAPADKEVTSNPSPSPAPAPADKQEVNHNPSPSPAPAQANPMIQMDAEMVCPTPSDCDASFNGLNLDIESIKTEFKSTKISNIVGPISNVTVESDKHYMKIRITGPNVEQIFNDNESREKLQEEIQKILCEKAREKDPTLTSDRCKVTLLRGSILVIFEILPEEESKPPTTSRGTVINESSEMEEFKQFMSTFNMPAGAENIIQFEPEGVSGVFAPYIRIV